MNRTISTACAQAFRSGSFWIGAAGTALALLTALFSPLYEAFTQALFSEKLRLDYAVHQGEYVHLEAMRLGMANQSMNQIRWEVFLLAGLLAGWCVSVCLPP
jgi:hypothetical protein